ncbi:MAG: 30S ribosomal protein S6 [Parcubacteria group bacterium]|nr:30S ribosomal protein S6 [Parcubacteria group bacterium]
MEELAQRQQYELAFHLLPSFTETELDGKRREIEEIISKSGGLVSRYGEIKKTKLAYPLRKEKFSNFG